MILTDTLTPRAIMLADENSLRLPMIAPKDEACGPSTPPGSTAPSATKLSIPPRIRLPSRSRTGCWTCRSRKVKCDESRPNCGQCARLGHRCDYSPRLTFRDDTSRVVDRMSEVSVTGNAVWDSKARIHSPPATPRIYDSLPPFFMLTSDDEREKKAESSYPGTYHVIVNPESFSNLPEYSDETSSVDLSIGRLKIRRSSGTSSTPSQKDELRSIPETNDPNTVILDCFEESNHRSPLSHGTRARLSPASDITSASTLASPTFPPETHSALALNITSTNSSQEELLLIHFRDVVWKQLLQGQSSHYLFSPISSPVTPGVEIFEYLASTFQPLYHAMMAVSALSLARQHRSKSIDALQHYHQAFPSLQIALHDTNDLCSDGLFLTHFLLLIYEVAAAEEGGSNLWSHHMSHLLQISLMRVSTFGSERYPYIVWLVCNIDLHALLSGAGTGDFLKAMLENDMLPGSESQLHPVAPSGHSIIYPEEHNTLPSVLQINHETFIFATRLAFLAADIRQKGVYYDASPTSLNSVDAQARLYEIRNSFHHLWDCPHARYLCENMDVLPQRSREMLQNVAEAIVNSSQFDFRFIVFPLFIAGVSTSSAEQKMMAMDLVSSLEKQGIGRNATTTRHLLQMVYQSQTEQLMTIGHTANVEWADVMVRQGMQVVNFGL
ncbi:hypothetical protein UA08_00025 [Talaromyces atroroseus]|uniref:Zn(2)-C6 fungal-type domain-containing protein n=1 Tax=Talaromyces atroroseus TaxID=1441469 RepID=A0A225AXJ1_TALAT|nr:hypothetical protein UA08_00025 [Talaromyces atroroseus]OKL64333.1 hypothetical protein UA08_00025 [Talaromyces atroroseus]